MKCYNRNLPEYQELNDLVNNPIITDSLIARWQEVSKSTKYPSKADINKMLSKSKAVIKSKKYTYVDKLLDSLNNLNYVDKDTGIIMGSGIKLKNNERRVRNYLLFNDLPEDSFTILDGKLYINTDKIKEIPSLSKNTVKTLDVLNHLASVFPTVDIEIVSEKEAKNIYDNIPSSNKANVNFNSIKSFSYNGTAYLISNRVDQSTAIEEVLHPFIEALKIDNPELYNSLLKEAKAKYSDLAKQVSSTYTERSGFLNRDVELEFLTKALKQELKTSSSTIQKIKIWFHKLIQSLFSKITLSNISIDQLKDSMTLSDIARLINNPNTSIAFTNVKSNRVRYELDNTVRNKINIEVDTAIRKGNTEQANTINKLFRGILKDTDTDFPQFSAGDNPIILDDPTHIYFDPLDPNKEIISSTTSVSGKSKLDPKKYKINRDVGNVIDQMTEDIINYVDKETILSKFNDNTLFNRAAAESAYDIMYEKISDLRSNGSAIFAQVIVSGKTNLNNKDIYIGGAIDILVVEPDGKLRVLDLKTTNKRLSDVKDYKDYESKSYEVGDNSLLKKLAKLSTLKLSTKSKHSIQTGLYTRMLENMGLPISSNKRGIINLYVDIDRNQKFNQYVEFSIFQLFESSHNAIYIDKLNPLDESIVREREKKRLNDLREQEEEAKKAAEEFKNEIEDEEFGEDIVADTIIEIFEKFNQKILTRIDALNKIKKLNKVGKQEQLEKLDRFSTIIQLIIQLKKNPVGGESVTNKKIKDQYTSFLKIAISDLETVISALLVPKNAESRDFIDYIIDIQEFIATYQPLYEVVDSDVLNVHHKALMNKLAGLVRKLKDPVDGDNNLSLIDRAFDTHVRKVVKENTTREFTDEDFDQMMSEIRDIYAVSGYLMGELNNSRDTLSAIAKKIWHRQYQEFKDAVNARETLIIAAGAKLRRLMPGKSDKEIFGFMYEKDEEGNLTGNYITKIGDTYRKTIKALKERIVDEDGNFLRYRRTNSNSKAEDLSYNIDLYYRRKPWVDFWTPEKLENGELVDGDEHRYTDEFKQARAEVQTLVISPKGYFYWEDKDVSKDPDLAVKLEEFKKKYFEEDLREDAGWYPEVKGGQPTGILLPKDSIKPRVKNKYIEISKPDSEYLKLTQPDPNDALSVARYQFYKVFTDEYESLLEKLGPAVTNKMVGKMPRIFERTSKEALKKRSKWFANMFSKIGRNISNLFQESEEQITAKQQFVDSTGNVVHTIPMMYIGDVLNKDEIDRLEKKLIKLQNEPLTPVIEDNILKTMRELDIEKNKNTANELTYDLPKALVMFSTMAEKYEAMSAIEGTMTAFLKVMENRKYFTIKGFVDKQKVYKSKGIESNFYRRFSTFLKTNLYEENQEDNELVDYVVNKLTNYSSLAYVAFNPFGNVNNYMTGYLGNLIEGVAGRYISPEAFRKAKIEVNKSIFSHVGERVSKTAQKIARNSDEGDKPLTKLEAIDFLFRMRDNTDDVREVVRNKDGTINSSALAHYTKLVRDFGYYFQNAAEYKLQMEVSVAVMMDTTIMNPDTGDTLNLYDAYEYDPSTGELTVKDGYTTIVKAKKDLSKISLFSNAKIKKDDLGNTLYDVIGEYNDAFRYDLRYKMREINKLIHGSYAKEDALILQQSAWGKLIMQFHKWVAPAIRTRFRGEYYDETLGWTQGRYLSFASFVKFIAEQIFSKNREYKLTLLDYMKSKGLKEDGSQNDEKLLNRVMNIKRTMVELSLLLGLFLLRSSLNSMFEEEDDDELIERLKNWAQYQADRSYNELASLAGPFAIGSLTTFIKSPIASSRTLGEFSGLFETSLITLTQGIKYKFTNDPEDWFNNKDVFYQRTVREGQLKLNRELQDIVPVLYSIKKWTDFLYMESFYVK